MVGRTSGGFPPELFSLRDNEVRHLSQRFQRVRLPSESMAQVAFVLASVIIILSQSSAAPTSEDRAILCDSEGLLDPANISRLDSRSEAALCRSKRCLERGIIDCSVEKWTAPGKAFLVCNSSFMPQEHSLSSRNLNCEIKRDCIVKESCAITYELERIGKGREKRQEKPNPTPFIILVVVLVIACLGFIWIIRH